MYYNCCVFRLLCEKIPGCGLGPLGGTGGGTVAPEGVGEAGACLTQSFSLTLFKGCSKLTLALAPSQLLPSSSQPVNFFLILFKFT